LGEAAAVLGDVAAELSGYLETLNADPARLEQVLGRQADLKRLTRKYGADVDDVLAWARQARQRLAGLDTSEEAIAALAARRAELATALARHATALTTARTAAARALGDAVTVELAGLAMGQAQLSVAVYPTLAAEGDDAALTIAGTRLRAGPEGVDEVARVEELARMLAGLDDTDTGRAHAEELLLSATADKARECQTVL
ncbi:MAG TPA: hypothetical protein VN327_12280, partial [Pseudonocardiaceae bacterium]|nr:hypothetical protein [Pseudonocardiaceae bacterium]